MRMMMSILFFVGFALLCTWEVGPKFYETATREGADVLFIASTRKNDATQNNDNEGTASQKIDYHKLIENINPDGA